MKVDVLLLEKDPKTIFFVFLVLIDTDTFGQWSDITD